MWSHVLTQVRVPKHLHNSPWMFVAGNGLELAWASAAAGWLKPFIRLMCQHNSNLNTNVMYWPVPSESVRRTKPKCDQRQLLPDIKDEQWLSWGHHFILQAVFLLASSQNNSSKMMILLMVQENKHARDGERCFFFFLLQPWTVLNGGVSNSQPGKS